MKRTAELLINSKSRRSKHLMQRMVKSLEKQGFTLTNINTIDGSEPMSLIMSGIKKRQPPLLIVGGGDGTISDVVDHLVGSKIEIGLIPLGTTNNFARSLNIPLSIDDAIKTISRAKAKAVDLGKIDNEYFVNVTGIGLSAAVAKHVTHRTKQRYGRLAYALVGVNELIRHKPFDAIIEDKDSELKIHLKTHQLIVANGRFHAGREIATDTKLDNNQLVIFALGSGSKISLFWHTIDFYLGKRKKVSEASYMLGNNIKIHTSTKQLVEIDGEVRFYTPLAVGIAPKVILVRHKNRR